MVDVDIIRIVTYHPTDPLETKLEEDKGLVNDSSGLGNRRQKPSNFSDALLA